jgi:hypothetical protein
VFKVTAKPFKIVEGDELTTNMVEEIQVDCKAFHLLEGVQVNRKAL